MSDQLESTEGSDEIVSSLCSQLETLRCRIKELESENVKLSSQVSSCCCRCHEMKDNLNCNVRNDNGSIKNVCQMKAGGDKSDTDRSLKLKPGHALRVMRCQSRRYVALKVVYFGQRYNGFALEAQMQPTVESEIFRALEKTKLLLGNKKEIQYSRCGRTDKGVSAVGQVIALFLPSNLEEGTEDEESSVTSKKRYEGEIDYVRFLNRVLPKDIRIIGWSPAPDGFSARFSCLAREYKYLFWRDNLNVMAMESAAKKFVGEHDFRNFCKMDAINVHNYKRHITSFEVSPCSKSLEGSELWAVKVRGTAFLWHQVRCMVAVLFMIGQGLESPNVIDALLDVSRTSRKPQYCMASEIPLILQTCEFESLKFTCSTDAKTALRDHMKDACQIFEIQAAIFHEAMLASLSIETNDNILGNRKVKKKPNHIPLTLRPSEPSYEERRVKFNTRAGHVVYTPASFTRFTLRKSLDVNKIDELRDPSVIEAQSAKIELEDDIASFMEATI